MAWHGMDDHRGVQHGVLRGLFFPSFLSSSWLLLLVGSTGSLTMLDPISIFIPCIPKPGSCVSSIDGAAGVLDCCRRGPPNKLTGVIRRRKKQQKKHKYEPTEVSERARRQRRRMRSGGPDADVSNQVQVAYIAYRSAKQQSVPRAAQAFSHALTHSRRSA